METAFVLVSCEAGTTDKVTKKLQTIDEIKEVVVMRVVQVGMHKRPE